MRALFIGTALLLLTAATGCKHEIESYSPETAQEYLPLTTGKYIIYQLDSTVYTGFGRNLEVRRYQEKNEIGESFNDNLGRLSYRVVRYLRDSAGTQPWAHAGTYFITPTEKTVEVVENNRRTIRLAFPVTTGYAWKGNTYLPDDTYAPAYNFSNDNSLHFWDYTYGELTTETIADTTIQDILPVYLADEWENAADAFTVQVDTSYGSRSFAVDKYAKGIGLVYQELILWDYQNNPKVDKSTTPWTITYDPFYTGFGVKRTLLDHN
jgi:hypothetical protein